MKLLIEWARVPVPYRTICSILLLLSINLTLGTLFGEEKTITLEECIQSALATDPQTKAIKLDIAADRSKEWAARAAQLPAITVATTVNKINGTPNSAISVNNVPDSTLNGNNAKSNSVNWGDAGTAQGQVVYPIFQKGSILGLNDIPAVERAKAGRKINESLFSTAVQTVLFNVTNGYLTTSWYRERTELMKRQSELSDRRLEILKAQKDLNLSTPEDIIVAEVQAKVDRDNWQNAEIKEQAATTRLSVMIGKTDLPQTSLKKIEMLTIKTPTKNDLAATINPNHPTIRQQKAITEQSLQTFRESRAALLPTITANGTYTAANDLSGGKDQRFFSAFLQVSAPIFDFGGLISTMKEAEHRYDANKLKELQSQNDLFRQILTQLETWRNLGDSLGTQEKALAEQDRLFRKAKVQYEIGLINAKSFLETESTWISAKDQTESLRLNFLVSAAQLQQTAGGLWTWAK